jgi:hypothetical protein
MRAAGKRDRAISALWAVVALSVGCARLDDITGSGAAPPAANSFTKVYTEIIRPTCSNDFCHYNGVSLRYSALDMSSQVYAYWSLVGQPCGGTSCSQEGTRVVPGHPETSIMYLKVSETSPPCGSQMPADPVALTAQGTSVFSGTALPAEQQQLIHDWIQAGAQNN